MDPIDASMSMSSARLGQRISGEGDFEARPLVDLLERFDRCHRPRTATSRSQPDKESTMDATLRSVLNETEKGLLRSAEPKH